MSQIWRKVRHLRKGKALIKKVAKELIDWRMYDYVILVNHKEGKHINTITLMITTKHKIGWEKYGISRTFNTEYLLDTAMTPGCFTSPEGIVRFEIQKAIDELNSMTLSIPERER